MDHNPPFISCGSRPLIVEPAVPLPRCASKEVSAGGQRANLAGGADGGSAVLSEWVGDFI